VIEFATFAAGLNDSGLSDCGLSGSLCRELASCWADVSDAGGAVGFPYAPVDRAEVLAAVQVIAAKVAAGSVAVFVASDSSGVCGWVALERNPFELHQHWAWLRRLQSHPRSRGQRVGAQLLENLMAFARDDWDLDFVQLSLRGGRNLEEYYGKLGFTEIGRLPGGLRKSSGEQFDEVFMIRALEKEVP
jgi:GNAT superfamily N-acetyltransferase